MLLACQKCHRQYDVGSHPEGSLVRCLCGNLCRVAKQRARQVAMLHCSNCGGRLNDIGKGCEYCSSEVKLADRGLGPACPECFITTFAKAQHCHGCGVRIEPQTVLRAVSETSCPRCEHDLSEFESKELRYYSCTGCGGVWLQEELFQDIAERKDNTLASLMKSEVPVGQSIEDSVRYLPCPLCAQLMNRRNFADCSGVILDWCRGHGWWFDTYELERVIAFLQSGGMERSRNLTHERRMQDLRRQEHRVSQASLPVARYDPLPTGGTVMLRGLMALIRQFF